MCASRSWLYCDRVPCSIENSSFAEDSAAGCRRTSLMASRSLSGLYLEADTSEGDCDATDIMIVLCLNGSRELLFTRVTTQRKGDNSEALSA
jgi:hypothetical protein